MKKINFEAGTQVSPAKVIIDEIEHNVIPAVYEGNTPLSPFVLNTLQDNIEKEFQVDKTTISGKTSQEGTPIKNVNVYGVNEFDKDNYESLLGVLDSTYNTITTSTNATTIYKKCKRNTTYTISKLKGVRFRVATSIDTPATGVTIANVIYNETATSITITTDNTANYLLAYVYLNGTDTITLEEMINSIKIEEGEGTPYTPYSYGLLDLNLQKDTDTKTVTLVSKRLHEGDSVDENGFHYKGKTIVLDGTEDINIYEISDVGNLFRVDNVTPGANYDGSNNGNALCTHYIKSNYKNRANNSFYIYNTKQVDIIDNRFSTVEEFKTYLAEQYANGTPVTIEYELATAEDEGFNETNQTAWNTLEDLLINGYTFIDSSSDELQPTITLTEHTANEIHRENVEKFKELDTLTEKNILTTTIAAKYTISTGNAEKVTLKDTMAKVGNKLNVVNGDIVIGEGIRWVKISAQVYFYEKVTADKKSIQIAINDDIVATLSQIVDVPYSGFNIAERLYEVKEGDKISLYVKGAVNDTIFNGDTATYITVEAVA